MLTIDEYGYIPSCGYAKSTCFNGAVPRAVTKDISIGTCRLEFLESPPIIIDFKGVFENFLAGTNLFGTITPALLEIYTFGQERHWFNMHHLS